MKLIWCDVCGKVLEKEESILVFSAPVIPFKESFILCDDCSIRFRRKEYLFLSQCRTKNAKGRI